MQSVKNEAQTYQLKVEKLIQKPASEVFRALGEGRLILNCGANQETLEIDFRVGGKYSAKWLSYGVFNQGEFLEIIPNRKIVFTWCQNAKVSDKPDTVVTIDLREQGNATHLTLTHSGFTDQEGADDHTQGWNSGLNDLTAEMVQGKLKFNRLFKMPVQKLYDACKNPATFFGLLGELEKGHVDFKVGGTFKLPTEKGEIRGAFTEITPNQKIVFTWHSDCGGAPAEEKQGESQDESQVESKVILGFDTEEDGQSWLELVHEGLMTESQQKSHREGWDWLLTRMNS